MPGVVTYAERSSPAWLREGMAWAAERLMAVGHGRVESFEVLKDRPWSTVVRVTTTAGPVYWKAAGPGGRHEPGLLRLLSERVPDLLPRVIAMDAARAFLLLADAGTPLREQDLERRLAAWQRLLPRYARLQIASARSLDRPLALGVPDRRPGRIPAAFAETLDPRSDPGWLLQLPEPVRRRAGTLLPMLTRACEELDAAPVPAALDHGDLHAGNVLVRNDAVTLCDWGDASVSHPFCSLLLTLETELSSVPVPDRPRTARRLRDAYLDPFAAYASKDALRATFARATWVAHVARVLDWVHMLDGADAAEIVRWRPRVEATVNRWILHHEVLGLGEDAMFASLASDGA